MYHETEQWIRQHATRRNVIGVGVFLFLFTDLGDSILTFLLAGIIPGTRIIIPYWFMMAVYCGLIAAIITPYIERLLILRHARQLAAAKKQSRSHYATVRS